MRKSRARAWRAVATGTVAMTALLVTTARSPSPTPQGAGAPHAHLAAHEVQVAPDAYAPIVPTLARTAWRATASNAGPGASPAAVLDGDNGTFWQTAPGYDGPRTLTIDLGTPTVVSALHYLPRQDGPLDGTITRFSIWLSTDGRTWGPVVGYGTWVGDASEKVAEIMPTSTRYVRLTATATVGNQLASAAELNLLGARPGDQPPTLLLPRTGWTAVASDEETQAEGDVAYNVLDDDPYTIWHSEYSGVPAPLPHWITIDMQHPRLINGITYLPREGGGNGTIGQYQITLSNDGTTWGDPVAAGTWADDPSLKTASFAPTTARYVRLTALTEAGGRGPWSSAAEINVTRPLDPSVAGQWSAVISFPLVPVSAVLLPDDKLLTFSAYTDDSYSSTGEGLTQTAILDLDTAVVSTREVSNTHHEMFCSGISLLADGRVLVAGGSDSGATSLYDPATDTWSAGPPMNIPRGYQSDVTLSDGRVFTLGGSWSGGLGGKNAEVYSTSAGWQLLPDILATTIYTNDPAGVFRADNHGWFFAAHAGYVFHAGPSRAMHWFNTAGNGSVQSAGHRSTSNDAMNGDAVMYDVGKILTLGGSPAYDGEDATRRAYLIDISRGPGHRPTVTRLPDMAFARSFANSVVLPNGQVVVIGGQVHAAPFSDRTAILQPEIWTPSTQKFTLLASMAVPRDYHSVAVLLPDGRVFSGGGGLCGSCLTNHLDGQILTPPYLLKPNGSLRPRPRLVSAPAVLHPGSKVTVATKGAVTSFALVRVGSNTHTVDTDQRRVPLVPVKSHGGTFTLQLTADTGVLVPGAWLLFALDAHGVPSIAKQVMIG